MGTTYIKKRATEHVQPENDGGMRYKDVDLALKGEGGILAGF